GEKGDAKCKTLHAQQWDLRCHDPRRTRTPAGKSRLPKGVAHHVELVNDSTLRLKTLRAPMPADGGGGAGPSLRGPKARRPDCGRGDRCCALAAGLSLAIYVRKILKGTARPLRRLEQHQLSTHARRSENQCGRPKCQPSHLAALPADSAGSNWARRDVNRLSPPGERYDRRARSARNRIF